MSFVLSGLLWEWLLWLYVYMGENYKKEKETDPLKQIHGWVVVVILNLHFSNMSLDLLLKKDL